MTHEQRDPLPEPSPVLPGAARAGVIAGAGLVAVVGAAVALGAAAPASSPRTVTSAASLGGTLDGSAATDGAADAVVNGTVWQAPAGMSGGLGHLRGGGRHVGAITITAINGSSLSLQTESGWTRTVTVGGDVDIVKGGEEIALGDLAVGDEIHLGETRNEDGTFSLERIAVVVPMAGGTVTAVDDDSITVQGRHGLTREITTTGSTTYRLATADTTRAEVTVGDRIHAFGEAGAGDTFRATAVVVALPAVGGEVTATSSSGFTLELRDGTTVTVTVDGATEYLLPGVDDPGLDDIAVGDRVMAAGTQSGTTIDAQVVGGGRGHGRGGEGRFGRGFGGHGHGGGFGEGGVLPDQAPADDGAGFDDVPAEDTSQSG